MLEFTNEDDLKAIIRTVAKIFKAEGLDMLSNIVGSAVPSSYQSGYDDWNNGIYLYTIYLNLSVETFVKVKKEAKAYEEQVLASLLEVTPRLEDHVINSVKFLPIINPLSDDGMETTISRGEEPTFWKPGYFKLFLSHLSTFKKNTAILKEALEQYGISAFVAHEDIEPTREWQNEIEHGLFTMDALCAILMKGFKESNWTDQEIGIALGRNILVVPIIKDVNPYGFLGKYQGFKADGKNIGEVAFAIFETLSSNNRTSSTLLVRLSELFLLSNSSNDALKRIKALRLIKAIPKDRIDALRLRITENDTLKSVKVLNEFNALMQLYNLDPIKSSDFEKVAIASEDDLPF